MAWWKQKKTGKTSQPAKTSTPILRQPAIRLLEPRIMFDGAAVATATAQTHVADVHHVDTSHVDTSRDTVAVGTPAVAAPIDTTAKSVDVTPATTAATASSPIPPADSRNVLFVDSRVADSATLLADVAAGTDVVRLNSSSDGLGQMADYLNQHPGAKSVQIIAEGNDGDLWLGSTYLSNDSIANHADQLAAIGNNIQSGGDILIFACNTAKGESGLAFVDALAALTGRDIAASNDRTGAGSDWDLEISTGSIEATPLLSSASMSSYQHDLATITVTSSADSGAGSLRSAITAATSGDTITFNTGSMGSSTITLNGTQLTIAKNLTIDGDLNDDGTADITIDANYKSRVISVSSGNTVTLDGLVIQHGLLAGNGGVNGAIGQSSLGAGISNAGSLTLQDVTVRNNYAAGGGAGGGSFGVYVGGGGGGGGAKGGGTGGTGGSAGPGTGFYAGVSGSANTGGRGGGYSASYMGGRGGTSSGGAGGSGGVGAGSAYTGGGNGGTANNGSISIGGGGGGTGWNGAGPQGGAAVGGIYNASTGTLAIIGTSTISNNLGAGGGGGGGGATAYGSNANGGNGGVGVGGIRNQGGTVLITAANFAAMTGNAGASGTGGLATGGGSDGGTPSASNNIGTFSGGTTVTNYVPPPSITSATYDISTGVLAVTAATMTGGDTIDVSKLTLTGEGGSTYTLTSSNVTASSATAFSVTLNSTDRAALAQILNKNGTSSTGGTTFNIAAADDWDASVTSGNSADATSSVTVSNVNAAPAITNLNGDSVAWAGVGSTVVLDASANASLTDTEFGALNSGNGNWSGGSLTVQRSTAVSTDTFGFNTTGALFTVSGSNLQASGLTFATFTNTGGVLTISFTSSGTAATTALVNDVARHITYRNDTPAGDATVRFTLSDGNTSTTADTTVTSDTIYVTNTSDVSTIDPSNGVGLREAVAIAAADSTGTQTIVFSSALAGQTITLGSSLSIAENLTIDTDNASAVTIAGSGGISLGSGTTLSLSNGNNDTATISTVLSSSGGLTKSGVGTITLSGANTFTGATSVTGGTLALSGGSALDNANAVSVSSGAELAVVTSETIGSLTGAGTVTVYTSQTFTINNTVSSNFGGSLAGAGGLTVNQSSGNTNTLTLSGNNTGMTGAISLVNYGRLSADGDSSIANAAVVTVNGNSLLTLLTDQTIGSLASNAGTATIALGSFTLSTGSNNTSTTVAGVISGTGALTKQGSGTLTLSGTNTYTGSTTVSGGTLGLSGGTALADTSAVTVASGATLSLAAAETVGSLAGAGTVSLGTYTLTAGGDNTSTTFSGGLTGTGGLTKAGSGTLTLSGSTSSYDATTISAGTISVANDGNLGSGTVTLASGAGLTITGANIIDNAVTLTGNATVTTTANATLSGVVGGAYTLTKAGASMLTLSGTNTYGATTVSASTLRVAGDSNLGSSTVTLAAGTTLTVTGATTIDNAIALTGSATVSNAAAVTLSGNITGTGALIKAGTATLTLSGTDSYSGATSVSAGSLLVNGSLTATSSVTVSSGATLGGGGSITSNVTANSGGTLAPGNSGAGTLTINGNLTLSSGSTLAVDINGSTAGTGYDQVIVNGTVSVTGTTLSASHGYAAGSGDTYTVIDNDSTDSITGTFSGLSQGTTVTAAGNGTVLTARYNGGTGNDFTLTAPTVPVVTGVSSSTTNGNHKIGDTITITVTFDQTINVDITGGSPTLLLETGTVDRTATYTSGSGTSTLTFSYIVQAGDTSADLDYQSTSALALNGATIRDGASRNATLTLATPGTANSLGANKALVIDGVRPTASIVVADNSLSAGETSLVTITFSEAVTGFTNADLAIANGTLTAVSSSDGGITWTATLTPTASITDSTNLITLDNTGIADAAGNAGTGTTDSNNYAINTTRPTSSIVVADTALKIGDTSTVTITFSEAVTGLATNDFTVANGALSNLTSSDGGVTWTATLTPTTSITDATNVITLNNTGYSNVDGNTGTGTTDSNNYAVDTTRPTASIVVADTALKIGETSTVTITFSEAVTGLTTADFVTANGTLSNLSSSDGGITWTATLTPTASVEDATNLITLDNTGVTDAAGNAGSGTTDSNNYAVDTVRPTTISIVVADTALKIGDTSTVTITFGEAVSGFTTADLTVPNGSLSNLSSSDGGVTWTATLTPTASIEDATNLITLDNTGIVDAAGNAGSGTTDSNNYTVDTLRPTASIVVADTALAAGETSTVTITFSEAVSGFTTADLTVPNGALSNLSSSDGGITWTATLTPTASITDATNIITLDNTGVTDAAGNAGSGTTDSNNYAIDSVRPTASIVVADTALRVGETSLVTITFSEAVTGLTTADFTTANGTLSNLSSSDGGVTWTATLTPTASVEDATNLITLDNTGVADTAGNAGSGTTDSNNYAIDTVRPTAAIVVADTTLTAGETSTVTITFNEAVTGLTTADFTVANGALSSLSSSDGGVTWTATLTPTASISDATNIITLDNTGVADAAGNAGTGTTDSNNYVIDNVRPTSSIVVAGTSLVAGDTTTVTITFSEAVTGLTTADFTVANGALSNLSSSDGGITWTATLTPTAGIIDTTNIITLDNTGYIDIAGNAGTGTTDSNNYTLDALHPILANVNGGGTFVENGSAIVIDGDASIISAALDLLNSGAGDYHDASLVIVRSGTAVNTDSFGFSNGNGISLVSSNLVKNGQTIATFDTSTAGQLSITFTHANGEIPTHADVNAILQQLTYRSTSEEPGTYVNLDIVFNDGLGSNAGAIAGLNLTSINDAPINSVPALQDVNQDNSLTFNAGNGNQISVSDADASNVEVTLTANHGVISLSGTSGLSFSTGDGTSDATLVFAGSISDVNNALNNLVFTPTAGYNGDASIGISTSDLGATGGGGVQVDNDSVDIFVHPINPIITNIATTSSGAHGIGNVITITVTFDQNVNVNTNGGTPALLLETGTVDRSATYVEGSGSKTLIFNYTVQPGDVTPDLNYHDSAALTLNGGNIVSASNNAAILTLPAAGSTDSLAARYDVAIDGIAPTANITLEGSPSVYAKEASFLVQFSEPVNAVSAANFALATSGSVSATLGSITQVNDTTWRIAVTGIQGSGSISLVPGSTITDAVGNALGGSSSASFTAQLLPTPATPPTPAPVATPAVIPAPASGIAAPLIVLASNNASSGVLTSVQSLPLFSTVVAPIPSVVSTELPGLAQFTAPGQASSVQVQAGAESFDTHPATATTPSSLRAETASVSNAPIRTAPIAPANGFIERSAMNAAIQLRALPDLGNFAFKPGAQIYVALPAGTFSAATGNDVIVLARLANGDPLPPWLRFDSLTGTFSGKAPAGFKGELKIEIIIRDSKGNRASSHLDIRVDASASLLLPLNPDALFAATESLAAKPALSSQFAQFGRQAWDAEADALLNRLG